MARRSVLFSPGDRPELLRKAPDTDADVLVFDLEDAVVPSRREAAREHVHDVLTAPEFDPDAEVCVRVSASTAVETDLDVLLEGDPRIDAVMVPKVAGRGDVVRVERALHARGWDLAVFALLETAKGILAAEGIADTSSTEALVFGAEDLAADVGATRTDEGTEVLYARQRVVLAAAAAGVDAIDTVYPAFEDLDGLADETSFALSLGYDGKLAVHPSQVPVVNDAFTPEEEAVDWARKVLDARDEARRNDRGVFAVDGEMIDAPLVTQAERILDRARAAGVL
jgi:citrate lyase subunit beta/citryl-CoA lyase